METLLVLNTRPKWHDCAAYHCVRYDDTFEVVWRPTRVSRIPVDSFKDVSSDALRVQLKGELLHRSLEAIIEPLKVASKEGVAMWCADGRLRRVYPIVASWIGDWPEQNDVSCTIRSGDAWSGGDSGCVTRMATDREHGRAQTARTEALVAVLGGPPPRPLRELHYTRFAASAAQGAVQNTRYGVGR